MNFDELDPYQFELLCGSLLAAEGYRNVHPFAKPGQPDRGIDWVFEEAGGPTLIANVKHFRRGKAFPSAIRQAISDIVNAFTFLDAKSALLIISTTVDQTILRSIGFPPSSIQIWDSTILNALLEKHVKVKQQFAELIQAQRRTESLIAGNVESTPENEIAKKLIDRLESIEKGRPGWRAYEDTCIEILNYVFLPPLRTPRIQSSSEDGLDRRDAIYPIGSGNAFWDSIKYDFSSRMMVAEFKNFADPIGQSEVESLQQYLLPKAKRSFGLLCSRHPPSDSALRARRRAWMIAENLILFISDDDLKEMVRRRADDDKPALVLESQLDEFFVQLAP